MSKQQVVYSLPKTLLELTSKNASFNSEQFPVNNNPNIQIELHTLSASSLNSVASIQGSLDGSSWLTLDNTQATITGNDDILWSLSSIDALMFLRVSVVISGGSAIFNILYRGC